MDLVGVMGAAQDEVLDEAAAALERSHLKHYELAGPEGSRQRLSDLYALVVGCLAQRQLAEMTEYAETVAQERFSAGFDISEVQTAFNVLEEAIWTVVIPRIPADELAEATGLIGTVLGAGKDSLARAWVSLATSRHVPSLDLSALFQGTGG
jgi:hypothetical protein